MGTGQSGSRVTGYQFTIKQMIKLPVTELAPFPSSASQDLDAVMSMNASPRPPPVFVSSRDIVLLRSSAIHLHQLRCRAPGYTIACSSVTSIEETVVSDSISFLCEKTSNPCRSSWNGCCRDTMMLAREYDMCNDVLYFNTVDNVLLVQHTNSSVVAIYDLASPSSLPIGSPLPVSGTFFQVTVYPIQDVCEQVRCFV